VTNDCPVGQLCVATAGSNICRVPQLGEGEGEGEGEVLSLVTDTDGGNAPLDVKLTWHVTGVTLSSCVLHDASGQSADFPLSGLDGARDVTLEHSATFTVVCGTQSSALVDVRVSRADLVDPPDATTQNSSVPIHWTEEEATCHIEGCTTSNVTNTSAIVAATSDPTNCTLSCEGLGGTFTESVRIRVLLLSDVQIAPRTVNSGGSVDVTFTSNDDATCKVDIAPIGGTPTLVPASVSDGQGHATIPLASSASVTVTCTLLSQTLTSDPTVVAVTPVITQFDAHASATDFTVLVSANGASGCTVQEQNAGVPTGSSFAVTNGQAVITGRTGTLQYTATCVSPDHVTTSAVSGPFKVLWGSNFDTNLGDVQFVIGDVNAISSNSPVSLVSSSLLEIGGALAVTNNRGASTTVTLSALRSVGGNLAISNNAGSTQATFTTLASVGGNLAISNNTGSTQATFTGLTSVGGKFEINGNLFPQIGASDFPVLASVGGSFDVSGNTALPAVNFGSLASVGTTVKVSNNPAMSTLNMPSLRGIGGDEVSATLAILGNSPTLSCPTLLPLFCNLNPRPLDTDVVLKSFNIDCHPLNCP
jgi:hypothetical protein